MNNQFNAKSTAARESGMLRTALGSVKTVRDRRCLHDDDDSCDSSPSRWRGLAIAGASLAAMFGVAYLKAAADDGNYDDADAEDPI